MEQFDDALGKLLNDPDAMAQVMRLAQNLLPAPTEEGPEPTSGGKLPTPGPGGDRQSALLQALEPYLSPARREKLRRAMQLARLSGLIKTAMQLPDREESEAI